MGHASRLTPGGISFADCRVFIHLSPKLFLTHTLLSWYFSALAQSCYFFLVGTVLEMRVLYHRKRTWGPREWWRGNRKKKGSWRLFATSFSLPLFSDKVHNVPNQTLIKAAAFNRPHRSHSAQQKTLTAGWHWKSVADWKSFSECWVLSALRKTRLTSNFENSFPRSLKCLMLQRQSATA